MLYRQCLQLLENAPAAGRAELRAGFDALGRRDFAAAQIHFSTSDTLIPGRPEAPYGLALTQVTRGMYLTGLSYFIDALSREPLLFSCQRDFVASLKNVEMICRPLLTEKLRRVLLVCFRTTGLNHQLLLPLTMALVRAQGTGLCNDPLMHLLLTKCYLTDLEAERLFTQCRRHLLIRGDVTNTTLIAALATQGRNNGFIWPVSATEQRYIRNLRRRTDTAARLLLSMYHDLTEESLPQSSIVLAKPVSDPVSQKVQRQYDSFPYPAWTDLLSPSPEIPEPYPLGDILVAGCGTGRHALSLAARFPDRRVDAEDLSLKSLQLAAEKAKTYGITNIRFIQADILEPSETGKRYPWIECIGTLHHTSSPLQALANLRRRLSPGGRMKLGLYSRKARSFIQNVKLTYLHNSRPVRSVTRLRAERQRLLACPPDKDLHRLFGLSEFYYASGVKDLLFHEKERAFDPEEIGQMLDGLALSFLGFEVSPQMAAAFKQAYPGSSGKDLMEWAAFEETHPDCFLEMYQFWCEDSKNEQL